MIFRRKSLRIASVLLLVGIQAFVLFVVIPQGSSFFSRFYGANQYADGYDQLAANLAAGNGYRFYPDTAETLLREPGYPILLAGILIVLGKNFAAIKFINMMLAFIVTYLMTRIARKLSSNRLLVFGSPLIFLFHPGTLVAESRGGVEILFAFMLTLYVLTVYRALASNRSSDYLISGSVLGLTVLVRSTPILFPFFLLGYLLLFERRENPKISIFRNFSVTIIGMVVVLSPWIIRNYSLTEKFVPTASVLGVSAHTGLYLSTHKAIGNVVVDRDAAWERGELARELGYHFRAGYYQYFYSSADEVEFSHYLLMRVADEYTSSPLLFIRTVLLNLIKFWCGGKTWTAVVINAILQLPFLALAIIGTVLYWRNGRVKEIAPLALLIIYIVVVSIPILAQARYSEPLIPFLSILACITLVSAQRWFKNLDARCTETHSLHTGETAFTR